MGIEIVGIGLVGLGAVVTIFNVGYGVSNKSKSKNYVTKDSCKECGDSKDMQHAKNFNDLHEKINKVAVDVAWIKGRMEEMGK